MNPGVDTVPTRTVDVHAHVLVREIQAVVHGHPGLDEARALEARRTGQVPGTAPRTMPGDVMAQLTDVDRRLADMDAAGVDVQVLSVAPPQYRYWAEPDLARMICHCAHRGVAAVVAAEPQRLTGLGLVPLQHPQLCVEALDDALAQRLLGVEISSYAAPSSSAIRRWSRSGRARPRPARWSSCTPSGARSTSG